MLPCSTDPLNDRRHSVHFVAFAGAGEVGDAASIDTLRHIGGMTSIPQAFERALSVARKKQPIHNFTRVTLVFLSDGADNDMASCMRCLSYLKPMPCPCRFICVGFRGFPTSLASGKLFEVFGTANHACEPPVLSCDDPDEIEGAFVELCEMIDRPDALPPPLVSDVDAAVTLQDLLRVAKRAYNAAIVQSLYWKTVPEVRAFSDCKTILSRVRDELCDHVRCLKSDARFACGPAKLSATLRAPKTPSLLDQALSAGDAVQAMQRRVAECLDMASMGQRVAALGDEEKRSLVGFASQFGRLATKTLKYHSVDEARVKGSLVAFLAQYPKSACDAWLDSATRSKDMGDLSLFEVFSDAKGVLDLVRHHSFTLGDFVQKMPLYGYGIRLRELSQGAAMNCWLVEVDDVDLRGLTTTQVVQSARLDRDSPGALGVLGSPNCLVLVPSQHPGSDTSYLRFAASALMFPTTAVYFNDAHKSLCAATVTHLLGHLGEFYSATSVKGPAHHCLTILRESYRRVYLSDPPFKAYCDRLADDERFRECLVTESPAFEKSLACPHLTKYVFGIWLAAVEGRPWTAEQLRDRLKALLVELFHRAGAGPCWTAPALVKPAAEVVADRLDASVLSRPLAMGPTRSKALGRAMPVLSEPFKPHKMEPESILQPVELSQESLCRVRFMQFSVWSCKNIFLGLAQLSGVLQDFSPEMSKLDLAQMLKVGGVSDNVERTALVTYRVPMPLVNISNFFFSF